MVGMLNFLSPDNPRVKALLDRNPNSMMATMLKNAWSNLDRGTQPSNNMFGSNNADATSPLLPSTGQTSLGIRANDPGNYMKGRPISFAAGGMVTPQGGAVRPGAVMQPEPQLGATQPAQMGGNEIDQEAQRFVQQHPEEAQKIQAVIAMAIQSGELTSQELNMAVQLAKAALANPQSYPQLRQFAIKNSLGTEQDIPQQMDQGLLYVLIVAGKSMQNAGPQGDALQGQAPSPISTPEYSKDGGLTGDTPHLAKLHPREYVIPEDALIYHGKKHFDKLVEQARTPPDAK